MTHKQFIINHLFKSGISPKLRGFSMLIDAIMLAYQDRELLRGITKILYPELAKMHGTTATAVERNMRAAIYKSGIEQTNSEFIQNAVWQMVYHFEQE